MTVTLQTKQVSKIYNSGAMEIRAVDEVSIEVEAGEFVALVGPSGSGKTTMLAMLAGLLKASSGELLIDGREIGALSERQRTAFRREKIGFTFQSNNLVSYLTARENVALMLRLNKQYNRQGKQRVEDMLARLGLEDRMDNLPGQLSGGQQQRVAIARSLIHQPSVVLADEPTASLDTERSYQVVQIFADLIHENNKAGIMVTHDLRMCRFVDKVIQMVDGKVVNVLTDPVAIRELAGSSAFEPSRPVVQEPQPVDFPIYQPLDSLAGMA